MEEVPPLQEKTSDEEDTARQQHDTTRYTLTVDEASLLFGNAGVPRSPRSIMRYCAQGHLGCVKVDTERSEKYLVSEDSVHARIKELQQIMVTSHVAPELDMTRRNAPQRDEARHVAPSDEEHGELLEKVDRLEKENEKLKSNNRDLEITNRFKDMYIANADAKIAQRDTKIGRFERVVGKLETLLRIKAPDEDTSPIIRYLDAPSEPSQDFHTD